MNIVVRIARVSPGCYRAWCPALPGCNVFAESPGEAHKKIAFAVHGYVENMETTLLRELTTRWRQESAALEGAEALAVP